MNVRQATASSQATIAEPEAPATDTATAAPAPTPRHLQRPQLTTVLFDLDGTLLDTAPDLIGAANDLLAEKGHPPLPDGLYAPVVSHGSAAMIARSFNIGPHEARMQPLRARFLRLYRRRVSRLTRPFPGILELLDTLDAAGIRWGVVTNKPAWLTEPLLDDQGLAARASCIVSGDTVPCRKPDPRPIVHACERAGARPRETVVVGDAQRDIRAGTLAGTATLAALFGYICAEDNPTYWGADGLLGTPGELTRWLPDGTDRD
ncbi:MAG: HAD-IA family hydrolase [Ectothiorhodospiraceae bacterium]